MVVNGGKFDWAIWDPISDRSTQTNTVDRMTLHTAVTSAPDIYGPGKGPGGTYAHFYNPLNARIRQHQEIHHKAYADLNANGRVVAVEHQDNGHEMPFSESQIDDDARLFAHLVTHYGTPNRIATVDNTKGLAWHRLGIDGNFGAYDPSDRTTWCKKQTGQSWSNAFGKLCPYNTRIRQVDEIYQAAQKYIDGGSSTADTTAGDDDMALERFVRWRTTDQALPDDGQWHTIKVREDKEANEKQIVSGPADVISAVAYVSASGLGDEMYLDIRAYAVDDPSGGGNENVTSTSPYTRHFTEGGAVHAAFPFNWDLGKASAKDTVRRLRLEVRVSGKSKDAKIDGVRVEGWMRK